MEGEDAGVHGRDDMNACEVSEGGEKVDVEEESGKGYLSLKNKNKKCSNEKTKKQNKWSQPRMRLDLPPGGFLRLPVAALAPPDGAEGCGSFCCSSCSPSTSSGHSTGATKRQHFNAKHVSEWAKCNECYHSLFLVGSM